MRKIIFGSLENFYVTAICTGPISRGISRRLLQAGHTQEGAGRTTAGGESGVESFVVLTFVQWSRRKRATYGRAASATRGGLFLPEHIQAGGKAILAGESVARYFIWDAKRALDYL